MSKLYPPEIGGTIPAFYQDGTEVKLTVPFIMNKTVSQVNVSGFILIIKTVANSKLIGTLRVESSDCWNFDKGEVYFTIPHSTEDNSLFSKLYVGSYYKVQLAYINQENVIGYYSAVGVVKYTTKPVVAIDGLETADINMGQNVYVGTYSQEGGDITEKVYSYIFNIYDKSNNLYATSGEQLHNSFEDAYRYASRDKFVLTKDLEDNKVYYIEYIVKTINGATFSSEKYRISSKTTVNPEIKATLSATLNYDNGYIDIRLVGERDTNGVEYPATGQFVLKRGCSKDNYTEWNTILKFRLNGKPPSRWLWRDFTIEHGYTYRYALQQFNDKEMYSNKIYSEDIQGNFEDMFLWDGERQLKMRFNPKITSFKNTILETKTNTIGNKYPFTFRNKSVYYKEFPINGLISYFSDEEELFISKEDILLKNKTTNLIDENLTSERLFKLKVLEFFSDGKPKLFKSPTEGNYLVKLINVSMTPVDQVGRMLHNITATAYEVADFNYNNLLDLKFIEVKDFQDDMITRWETVDLSFVLKEENILQHAPAYMISLNNVIPGTILRFVYDNGDTSDIAIGITGQYQINSEEGIQSVSVVSGGASAGTLTYSYKTNAINTFDTIIGVDLNDIPMQQFVGAVDLLNELEDVRTKVLDFYYMRFIKRVVYDIYTDGIKYYWNSDCTSELSSKDYIPQYIYKVLAPTVGENNMYKPTVVHYLDGADPTKMITKEDYANTIIIDGVQIDITETEFYELKNPNLPQSVITSVGVVTECGYSSKIYDYNLCDDLLSEYQEAYNDYRDFLFYLNKTEKDDAKYLNNNGEFNSIFEAELEEKYLVLYPKNEPSLYEQYIVELEMALKAEEAEKNGDE